MAPLAGGSEGRRRGDEGGVTLGAGADDSAGSSSELSKMALSILLTPSNRLRNSKKKEKNGP